MMTIGAGNKPSRHGRLLGETLAALVEAGRRATSERLPDLCATCAFKAGSLPNQTAGTGLEALNTMLGIDSDDFACHHGMKDGRPTKLCKGVLIARLAPLHEVKAGMAHLKERLSALGEEDAAASDAFDAWLSRVDPGARMDVYELASVFAQQPPAMTARSARGPDRDGSST